LRQRIISNKSSREVTTPVLSHYHSCGSISGDSVAQRCTNALHYPFLTLSVLILTVGASFQSSVSLPTPHLKQMHDKFIEKKNIHRNPVHSLFALDNIPQIDYTILIHLLNIQEHQNERSKELSRNKF